MNIRGWRRIRMSSPVSPLARDHRLPRQVLRLCASCGSQAASVSCSLIRETKGTRDFLKLLSSEAEKVRCGQKHSEALGVPFEVVVTADEV
jgi:hypothetical protein